MRSCLTYVLCAGLLLGSACGPKQMPQESQFDTAANHYSMGLNRLEGGDLVAAQQEFDRAQQLDPDYAGGYVGAALVAMHQGDYSEARTQVRRAMAKDGDFVDAYVALGRIATEEGLKRGYPTRKWLGEAEEAFERGARKGPENTTVDFYRGISYKKAFRFEDAHRAFANVLAPNRGPLLERAMQEAELIQRIQRAAPGTDIGSKIALVSEITRGELAVLLIEELKLPEVVAKRRPAAADLSFRAAGEAIPAASAPTARATDTATHWAREWIEQVLELNIAGVDVFPDGTFQPDEAITRANHAMINQSILVLITGNQSLATKYLGEASRFADVRNDHFAYSAMALNADRGIMSADKISGAFHPTAPVSGADALLIIRELQNALRMEFQ